MTKTVMFNHYTGTPRHPSDIASDPEGLLILEPGEPLRAAAPQAAPAGAARVEWQPAPSDLADALKALLARCKCGVYLTVNEHRDYYDTPAQRLEELDTRECPPHISDEVRAGILSSGNIVELQFYPDTPVGFYVIVHHDLDEALRLALERVGAA